MSQTETPAPTPPAAGQLLPTVATTLLCYTCFLAACYLGFTLGRDAEPAGDPAEARAEVRAKLEDDDRWGHFVFIFGTNLGSALALMALGAASAGLYGPIQLAIWGFISGLTIAGSRALGFTSDFLLAHYLTHGVIEILAFSMAAAVGVRCGWAFVRFLRGLPPLRPGDQNAIARTAGLSVAILLAAAVVEVLVTPGVTLRYLD